ncbi:MAG: UDP-N-acetylmuramate dehydrogenase [Pseudomonadota bacterium]
MLGQAISEATVSQQKTVQQLCIANEKYDVSHIKGIIKINEPMSKHTTWKAGGVAKIYYQPESLLDLQQFLKMLKQHNQVHNILWLGLGSNVLIRDKGYNGIVINTVGKLKQIQIFKNTEQQLIVSAESGVSCSKFSREVAKAGLLGAEFFSGIPGSMGGAMAMNAGAFGNECWNHLDTVETIDDMGKIYSRKATDFNVSYRFIEGLKTTDKGVREWFVKGFFKYPYNMSKVEQTKAKIKNLLEKRNQSQPVQYANAGSVFKNPPGDFAARLIELCGLKNQQIGNAVISEKHANFIVNPGGASAKDIEMLIEKIQQCVYKKFAVKLQTEVRIFGER